VNEAGETLTVEQLIVARVGGKELTVLRPVHMRDEARVTLRSNRDKAGVMATTFF